MTDQYHSDLFILWQDGHARGQQTAFEEIEETIQAFFDDQAFLTPPCDSIELPQTELVQTSDYEITANFTVPEPQEIAMPINVHAGVLDDMVAMRVLMQSDSARAFIKVINKAPGWTVIFQEYWYWLAAVLPTPLEFVNFLKEALAGHSFHPSFILENIPVKLPNLIDTYTQSDNKDFIKAFKDVLGSVRKMFINHCYAQSCNLLVDIPLENYIGILSNSLHAVPPNYWKYVKEGVEWDPR
ncbi:hypothetical protein SCLCIDRAFT_28086 [Scleroderma citrinum Foug A]|uniref:Uncharacterized protein n=1 Tax=Scleroderma citrinum Foug A TaxID=1036808 RepID=A0A0C2Z923_9AGAM|nr:hypothetical protein SCLCIDRAFT_28086 [Scleroderma citrinum Foug A]